MSKKKRKVTKKPLFPQVDLKLSAANKTGWLAYLKNPSHWWVVILILLLALGALGVSLKYLKEDPQRQKTKRTANDENLISRVDPSIPNPMPSSTPPPLSREYIYAGSKVLAIEDANANAAPPADISVWRPSSGAWWVMGGVGSQQTSQSWGAVGDVPAQGDYDGDSKTDFCVFRPSNNNWYLIYSSNGSTAQFPFGTSGDQAAPADYDGDGKTDIAIFRSSNATWYINQSSTTNTISVSFGVSSDMPIPADFDGDGKADVSVWRNSNNTFSSLNSTNGQTQTTSYGLAGDKPVCGDYDGDGRADIAVWRTSNTTWYYKKSTDGATVSYQWGIATDLPVQNDFDADGKVDRALWRAVNSGAGDVGRWYILQSTNGTIRQEQWGISGDIPVPAYYRR